MTETLTPTIELTDPRPIEHFDPPGLGITPAEQPDRIRVQAPEFKGWLEATGVGRAFRRPLAGHPPLPHPVGALGGLLHAGPARRADDQPDVRHPVTCQRPPPDAGGGAVGLRTRRQHPVRQCQH
jgi:hypothetical protein